MVSAKTAWAVLAALVCAWALEASDARADSGPSCEPGWSTAEPGAPPRVAFWIEIEIPAEPGCLQPLAGPAATVTSVDGAMRWDGDVRALAARIGAVSTTRGLVYWSTTEQGWRELVSEATALENADAEARRADFTADEVLSGAPLHFAQDDTRSSGMNVYEMRVEAATDSRLVLSVENVDPILMSFVTIYAARSVRALQIFERTGDGHWRYRSISAIARGNIPVTAASLANRASAVIHALFETAEDPERPAMR